jgi:hypothetical protein
MYGASEIDSDAKELGDALARCYEEANRAERVLLMLLASLTLADHMGDASNYMWDALKLAFPAIHAEVEIAEEDCDEPMEALAMVLQRHGVTTLYGTSIGGEDDD